MIRRGFWWALGKFERISFQFQLIACWLTSEIRTTTAWMGALSVGTVVSAYLFKRYPVRTPDHEVVMAGQIRAEREDQHKGSVA